MSTQGGVQDGGVSIFKLMDMGFTFEASWAALQSTSTGDDFDEAFDILRIQVPPAARYISSSSRTNGNNETAQNTSIGTTGPEQSSAPEIYAALLQLQEMAQQNFALQVETLVDALMSGVSGQACEADVRDMSQRLMQRIVGPMKAYKVDLDQLEDVSSHDIPDMRRRIEYLFRDISGRVKAFHVAMNAALEGQASRGWETPAMSMARQQSERELHVSKLYKEQNEALAAAARMEPSSPVEPPQIHRVGSRKECNAEYGPAQNRLDWLQDNFGRNEATDFRPHRDEPYTQPGSSNRPRFTASQARNGSTAFADDYFGLVGAKPWQASLPVMSSDHRPRNAMYNDEDSDGGRFRATTRADPSLRARSRGKSAMTPAEPLTDKLDDGRIGWLRGRTVMSTSKTSDSRGKVYESESSDSEAELSTKETTARRMVKTKANKGKVKRQDRDRSVDLLLPDSDDDQAKTTSNRSATPSGRSVSNNAGRSGILKSTKPAKDESLHSVMDDLESLALDSSNQSQVSKATRRKSVSFEASDANTPETAAAVARSNSSPKDPRRNSSRSPATPKKAEPTSKSKSGTERNSSKKRGIPGSYDDSDSSDKENSGRRNSLSTLARLKVDWKELRQEIEDFLDNLPSRRSGRRAKEYYRLVKLMDEMVLAPMKAIKAEGPQKREIRTAKNVLRDEVEDCLAELDEYKPEE